MSEAAASGDNVRRHGFGCKLFHFSAVGGSSETSVSMSHARPGLSSGGSVGLQGTVECEGEMREGLLPVEPQGILTGSRKNFTAAAVRPWAAR